jgi:FRG domain
MDEIELDDWVEYKQYVADNFSGNLNYIFRGHADRNWKLESTLSRLNQRVSNKLDTNILERDQLQNFRMKIRGLRVSNLEPLNDNELWSLGQHYGLCTPLLDWTESPYIAAYFAFENANSCKNNWRTIIAFNKTPILDNMKNYLDKGFELLEPMYNDNNRMIAQAGLFTKIPTETCLEDWIKKYELEKHLTKLHIENDNRLEVINDLKLMNITGSTIYPDLHGASISCNMLIESLSENIEFNDAVTDILKALT